MRRVPVWLNVLWASAVGACAGYDDPEFPEIPPEPPAPVRDAGQAPAGALWRHELIGVVEAGLGRFLQKVRVEAALEQGSFVGFRIVELHPATFWEGVDLRPGDVVTRVNGKPIQRDTEAYEVFQSLKQAQELRVNLLRDGHPRELSYRILQKPGQPAPAPEPAAPDPAAPALTPTGSSAPATEAAQQPHG